MAYSPITQTATIDLTAEELDLGDVGAFVTKMASMHTKIQTQLNDIGTAIASINTLGSELDSVQLDDMSTIEAEINARKAAVTGLQDDIDALASNLGSLSTAQINGLNALLDAIDQKLTNETANRTAENTNVDTAISSVSSRIDVLLATSGLDLAGLSTAADSIAALVTAAGGLTIASIDGLQERLDLLSKLVVATTPNHLEDDGRFLAPTDPFNYDFGNDDPLDLTTFTRVLLGYNGADLTAATEWGRFYYNNINNGGVMGPNNAGTVRFLNAMGIADSRYAPGFYIIEITAGTGTAQEGHDGHYRIFNSQILTQEIRGVDFAFSMWFECSETVAILGSIDGSDNYVAYLDGEILPRTEGEYYDANNYHVIPANEVHHYATCARQEPKTPYNGTMLKFYTKPGALLRIALPVAKPIFGQIQPNSGVYY